MVFTVTCLKYPLKVVEVVYLNNCVSCLVGSVSLQLGLENKHFLCLCQIEFIVYNHIRQIIYVQRCKVPNKNNYK